MRNHAAIPVLKHNPFYRVKMDCSTQTSVPAKITVPFARLVEIMPGDPKTEKVLRVHDGEHAIINTMTGLLTISHTGEMFQKPFMYVSTKRVKKGFLKLHIHDGQFAHFLSYGEPKKVIKSANGNAIIQLGARTHGITFIEMHAM